LLIVVSRVTVGSQFDEDSELLERFEEFEEETGYGNRSKAVRAVIRRGLDQYDEEQREGGQRAYTAVEESLLTVASVIAGAVLFLPLLSFFGYASTTSVLAAGAVYLAIAAAVVIGVDFRARRAGKSSNSGVSN
jgi:hypothetical protein